MRKLGPKLRRVFKSLRMSQGFVGERLGVGQTTVSSWFGGRTVPDAYQLFELARLAGVPMDYLLDDSIEDVRELSAVGDERAVLATVRALRLPLDEVIRRLHHAAGASEDWVLVSRRDGSAQTRADDPGPQSAGGPLRKR